MRYCWTCNCIQCFICLYACTYLSVLYCVWWNYIWFYLMWCIIVCIWYSFDVACDVAIDFMYGYMLYIILFQYSLWLTSSSSSPHNHPHPLHPSKLLEIKVWYIILFLSLLHCSWFDVMHYCLNKLYHMPLYTVLMYAWLYKCMCVWINMYVWNVWYVWYIYMYVCIVVSTI